MVVIELLCSYISILSRVNSLDMPIYSVQDCSLRYSSLTKPRASPLLLSLL